MVVRRSAFLKPLPPREALLPWHSRGPGAGRLPSPTALAYIPLADIQSFRDGFRGLFLPGE
jgi:hypothetical protein